MQRLLEENATAGNKKSNGDGENGDAEETGGQQQKRKADGDD